MCDPASKRAQRDARELTGRNADKQKALAALGEAERMFAKKLAWRQRARDAVAPQLSVYEEAIRDTIGLRQQPRLPEDEALAVATCMSYHRDLSLYF